MCRDFDETVGCLRSLDAPHYHHELTKRALLAAFEKPEQAPALLQLLQRLTDMGVVSQVDTDALSSGGSPTGDHQTMLTMPYGVR